jgi:hypothetical protein
MGHPSSGVVVSYIFVVELQFLLHMQSKLQHFVVTNFILYMHVLMCFMQLRKTLCSMGVFGS